MTFSRYDVETGFVLAAVLAILAVVLLVAREATSPTPPVRDTIAPAVYQHPEEEP